MKDYDSAALKEYRKQGFEDPNGDAEDGQWGESEVKGVPNTSADQIPRVDRTWSDLNLDRKRFGPSFDRLVCRVCKGTSFEVLSTGGYETTAKCDCGIYYVVHTG